MTEVIQIKVRLFFCDSCQKDHISVNYMKIVIIYIFRLKIMVDGVVAATISK